MIPEDVKNAARFLGQLRGFLGRYGLSQIQRQCHQHWRSLVDYIEEDERREKEAAIASQVAVPAPEPKAKPKKMPKVFKDLIEEAK